MMPFKPTKAKVAMEYRERYGWEMPTMKLARIMHKENSILFADSESARDTLRYIEYKHGKQRKAVKYTEHQEQPPRSMNPYKLPDSDKKPYEPYHLEAKRVFVFSDVHIPFHDMDALTAVFDWAVEEKPDAVLMNGDIIDMYQLSRWIRNPKQRSFADELAAFSKFFEIVKTTFNAKIYFKFGNHEERYDHFLMMKAHELQGVEEFELANIIKARAEGVEIIKDKRIVKLGDLNVIHGHEYVQGIFNSVNVARGLFLKAKVSAMQGHNHQVSEHTETDMNGNITTTWSLGCLCDLHPEYARLNRWSQGAAMVDIDGNNFTVRNKRIHNGQLL